MATLRRTYRYRLAPSPAQAEALAQLAGARRWVWNWALARRTESYQATGKSVAWGALSKELTALKRAPETAWLADMDSQALQQGLADLQGAFAAFFAKRAGFPQWRRKFGTAETFRIPQRVRLDGDHVVIPKVGRVAVRGTRGPAARVVVGATKSATFKIDASGHWHVTLVVEVAVLEGPLPLPVDPATVVGIDLGLTTLAVLSNGETVAPPTFFRRAQKRLAKKARAVSRCQRGSKNRHKAKRRLARAHQRVANQRKDFTHQLTTAWVRAYAGLCLEDLSVQGLAKTKLGKSILDASFGMIRQQLAYKAAHAGVYLGMVGRFQPTTTVCHVCQAPARALTLADRTWTCAACHTWHDRDVNASQQIKWLAYDVYRPHPSSSAWPRDTRTPETLC